MWRAAKPAFADTADCAPAFESLLTQDQSDASHEINVFGMWFDKQHWLSTFLPIKRRPHAFREATGGQDATFAVQQSNLVGGKTTKPLSLTYCLLTMAAALTAQDLIADPNTTQPIIQPRSANLNVNRFENIRHADQFTNERRLFDLPQQGGVIFIGSQNDVRTT
jgi:hypothetical protein